MEENENLAKQNVPEFCVDTNIIIYLEQLLNGNIKYNLNLNVYKVNHKSFMKLFEKLQQEEIKFYLPYTAYHELCVGAETKGYGFLDVLKTFNIKVLDYKNPKKNIRFSYHRLLVDLANKYCKPLDKDNIQYLQTRLRDHGPNYNLQKPPFELNKYNFADNDALIMATSTIAHLPLITFNTFCFLNANKPDVIGQINLINGFEFDYQPISCNKAVQMIDENKRFERLSKNIENFSYTADEIAKVRKIETDHTF